MRYLLVIFASWVFCAGTAEAVRDSLTFGGLDVTVWSQQTETKAKQPVLIFSHGFHGCATQSRFLMEAFATEGYLVFAPNHRDATCDHGGASLLAGPQVAFGRPELWNDTT